MLTTDKSRFFRRCATGSSALALATALAASPAGAQSASLSYNAGNPTVASGTVTFSRGQTPGVETYNVQTPTAVLDFTPSDTTGTGTINFQNAGTTAVYQGSSNFTVLNRIVPSDPSRAIQFNGTVRSLVNSSPGGSVWFYSPGGILLGSSAVFDVGSLLLSTGDPTGGSGSIGSATSFTLNSAANSNAAVTIQPGAQITATPEGSYVALVAPVINQNGAVRVNGSAAYVAAEQATLSINQGLFDISVAVGSDGNGTPLTHNGTTTGPASTGGGDNQGIFMVAVPKNTAITMLIAPNGQLGFDVAGSASVENGAVYLQAGGNLSIDPSETVVNRIVDLPASSPGASIQINSGNFTSPLAAQASADVLVTAGASPGITLAGDSYFYGAHSAHIVAAANGLLSAAKSVVVDSFGAVPGTAQVDALSGSTMTFADLDVRADTLSGRVFSSLIDTSTGGAAAVRSTGGTINASGAVRVGAVGSSGDPVSTLGGNADITAVSGGTITIAGLAIVDASASVAGDTLLATGGQANVFADGGTVKTLNGLSVNATATGVQGASGKGGSALVTTGTNGGTIEAQTITLTADGLGSFGLSGSAGSGTGGSALIQTQATTGAASITTGNLSLSANGVGGNASSAGTSGGLATGGLARVLIGGGSTTTTSASLDASANGGSGLGGGNGGDATAGSIEVTSTGGTFSTSVLSLTTGAFGGSGGNALASTTPGGTGGRALPGGGATIFVNGGGSITADSTIIASSATGGVGGNGFNGGLAGSGGAATASNVGISTGGPGTITLGSVNLFANAFGGSSGSGLAQPGGTGGAAQGADAFVFAGTGTITAGSLTLSSDATGGFGAADGSSGGDATGGNATLGGDTGGMVNVLGGSLQISAEGFAGSVNSAATGGGVGGKGVGGTAVIFANGGSIVDSKATSISIEASGDGGSASGSGNGGVGQGGSARVNAGGGTIMLASDLNLDASGNGGSASGSGNAGNGLGGETRLGTFSGATASKVVLTGNLEADASGNGGFASIGKGGDGIGGAPPDADNGPFDKGAYVVAIGGSVSVSGTLDMDASGSGGGGAAGGGAGTGGLTNIVSFGAAISAPGSVFLDSSGNGGDGFGGAAGGVGTGGSSIVVATSGGDSLGGGAVTAGLPGSVTLGAVFQDVSGQGGDGGTGATGGSGGIGGDGFGGITNLLAQAGSGTLVTGDVTMEISGLGGDGGQGGDAAPSGGTGGNGGRGGDGTGGFTNFGTASGPATSNNDGTATLGNVQVAVFGGGGTGGDGTSGGNGGAGGNGFGGTATLLSRGAHVDTQAVNLLGFAIGGTGGTGATDGVGGNASGGNIGLLATNRFQRTERGSVTATSFSASAYAQGGTGSTAGSTTAGQVSAQVTQADVTLDSLALFTFGLDAAAAGSESSLLVDAGTLTVNGEASTSTIGDLRFGAVNGGMLKANSLFLSATGSLLPPASGTPGTIDIANGFSATFGGAFVTTSNFTTDSFFQVSAGGQLQVGDVTSGGIVSLSSTDGSLTTGDIAAAQGLNLEAQTNLSAGDLTTENGYGTITLRSGEGNIAAGDIRSADGVSAFASGSIALGDVTAGLGDPSLVFGAVQIGASGAIDLGDVRAPSVDIFTDEGAVAPFGGIRTGAITAESITIDGLGDVSTGNLKTGDIYAGIDVGDNYLIGVATDGAINLGTIETPTSVGLASRGASVTAGAITAGDSVLILAKTNITAGGIAGGTGPDNNVFLSNISVLQTDPVFEGFQTLDDFSFFDPATLGNATPVRVDGLIRLTGPVSTGGFAAAASGGFDTGSISAANRLLLDSGASLALGDLSTNQALNLTSGGALTVGNVRATTVDLRATDSVTAGGIDASGAVNVTAGTFASFSGTVGGSTINVASSDLRLGQSARLGTAQTTQLSLNAQGASQFNFGGTGGAGYSIDAAEAQGLRAQRIDITTSAPVSIGAVTLNGSGVGSAANLVGEGGQLTIATDGDIRVGGAFTIANAGAGDQLVLRSSGRIAVATDSGGALTMTGAGSGTLGGTIQLVGDSIAVATAGLLDQLAANPNFAGRNQALSTPSSSPRLEGSLQANRLELDAASLIAIQNSGSADQAAGFSAGSGGMQINSRSSSNAPLDVFAFGRVADSSGAFKMNQDTLAAITLSTGEGSGFTPASAVNNCVIGGSSCAAAPPPPPPPPPGPDPIVIDRIPASIADAVQGTLSSAADPEKVAALPTVTLITAIDTGQLRTDPVISDPVSGGGNPSLWETPDDQQRDDDPKPRPGQGDDK